MHPQPGTEALQDDYFVVVLDTTRKLFDIRGPSRSDERVQIDVVGANNSRGVHWKIFTAQKGPCYAEQVRAATQAANRGYVFVRSAMALSPQPVVITRRPGIWTWS